MPEKSDLRLLCGKKPGLSLVPATASWLKLELEDRAAFVRELGVACGADWPPGEYDQDAIQFFYEQTLSAGPAAAGWYAWYAIYQPDQAGPRHLVGSGGFLGPADGEGCVEVGYSICAEWRRQGMATAMLDALIQFAWQGGAGTIRAHVDADNHASIGALEKNQFRPVASEQAGQLCWKLSRASESSR